MHIGARFIIPPVVNYEIRRGLMIKSIPAYEEAYAVISDNCMLGEMTTEIWECAARIYAGLYTKRFTIDDADLLIAAFCLVNGYTLVTNNTKHFKVIDELQITDWATE